jgi:hypothetical protein
VATATLNWLRNPYVWVVLGLLALAGGAVWFIRKYARHRLPGMNSPFKYFDYSEFDSPDAPGSGQQHMSADLIRRLDKIREAVGFPLLVSSGYRTPAHNAKVGGVAGSSHTKGLAVDLRAATDAQKRAIAKAAIAQGIVRIGWGRTFIHLDIDGSKPQRVAWGYTGSPAPPFNSLA